MTYPEYTGNTSYNPYAALNSERKEKMARGEARGEILQEHTTSIIYERVLDWVQNTISSSESYNRILQESLNGSEDANEERLKGLIRELLNRYTVPLDREMVDEFCLKIYNDMAGFGILTEPLNDPHVEEINIYGHGSGQIEIITNDHRGTFMMKEGFPDADSVLNMVKRMVRKGNMVIDKANPRVDSYMDAGTRISAMIPPIVREDKGAVASIRKQTESRITKSSLENSKTAAPEELAFIELCTRNKISGAIVGATGSGKTTLLNYVMTDYVLNSQEHHRVYIIEESRELQLPKKARVFYTAVCGDEKNGTAVSADDLLKSALRFHPTFISTAEMRGAEALNAMNSAQTGHIVWSTFHAETCEEAYSRLLTMCTQAGTNLSENLLMRNLVSAFSIMVSAMQLKDGSRKITGIYEATGVNGTEVVGHYIYRMMVDHFEYDEFGQVTHVHGAHCRVGDLSDKKAQKIFDNCGRLEDVKPFAREGWVPEKFRDMTGVRVLETF